MATTAKKQLLNRARSIQGHMGAVVRMLERKFPVKVSNLRVNG